VYARSTTILAQTSAIEAGIAYVRDQVLPAADGITGCVGLSLLVNRQHGRCIATSAWDSAEAMYSSADQVRSVRDRAAEMFGAVRTEEWEISVLHREHHSRRGACVRVVWAETAPERLDAVVEAYRSQFLADMKALEGFCSASLMINRSTGRAVSCAAYDSAVAMIRARGHAASLRAAASRRYDAVVIDTGEFELALAHLRVPELV
jgi:hypothetical protein